MGGSSSSIPKDIHFVIIGGGYGGLALARCCKKDGLNFTLINDKDAFHHNVAAVRAVTVKGKHKHVFPCSPYHVIIEKHQPNFSYFFKNGN
jgi:NADH dehydrogenase FAD-containing subunit